MITEHSAITEPVHRLEVFTGRGRRRTWSAEDKARIVGEIATSGDSVSGVARRHGLSPQQLFGWRRELQGAEAGQSKAEGLQFVPAAAAAPVRRRRRAPCCDAEPEVGLIEVEIAGMTIRIGRGADAETVAAVLRVLKAGV